MTESKAIIKHIATVNQKTMTQYFVPIDNSSAQNRPEQFRLKKIHRPVCMIPLATMTNAADPKTTFTTVLITNLIISSIFKAYFQ